MRSADALLHTGSGSHRLRLRLANRWWQRLRGLMFAPDLQAPHIGQACEGLLLMPCNSVHGMCLRQRLDLVYLGASEQPSCWKVLRLAQLKPWAFSVHWSSRHTLELPAGAIMAFGVRVGDVLELRGA
jgi:uncharacterized membrane protein (UPF0127 family)